MLDSFTWGDADVTVIVSPHGSASGVYEAISGSLDGFGERGHDASATTDTALRDALASSWGRRLLSGPVDHGIAVPLLLAGAPSHPVVAVALADATGPDAGDLDETLADARGLADALVTTLGGARALVACSAHTSAALGERSPVPNPSDHERVKLLESQALAALAGDPADLEPVVRSLAEEAASCGAGPLQVYASLFAGCASKLLAYDDSFGVGYALAMTEALEG